MTSVVIFILFIMNILFAFVLILLYMRQNRFVEMEKRQQRLLAESEHVIAALLAEFKEENDTFLTKIKEGQQSAVNSVSDLKEKNGAEEALEKAAHSREMNDELPEEALVEMNTEDDSVSLHRQVESLAAKGLTVTEIARTLEKGKTEIELLMKFR